MKAIQAIKDNLKAFWGSGDWIGRSHYPGGRYPYSPGTNYDYARDVGALHTNSAIQACLNKLIMAWPESYPCVKEEVEEKKTKVEDHPLTALLNMPNSADDDTVLWAGTIADFWTDGNAYWGINRKRQTGFLGEFVYLPCSSVTPKRREGSRSIGPDYFEIYQDGQTIKVPPTDIVHYRFGRDPYNDLLGMAALASVPREVYTDNEAVNYINSMLKNKGAAWLIASPKEKDAFFNDPKGLKDRIEAQTQGDNRHRVLVLNGATEITYPPTVKDTGPNELRSRPEARICALMGLPPMWVGLTAGLERSTYSNMEEAAKDAWQTIVAVQRMMGRQLTMQVLRRPGNFPAKWQDNRYFAGFDYSEVRALQPNKVEEWKRAGDAYQTHKIITKDEARAEIDYPLLTPEQRAEMESEVEAAKPNPPAADAQKPKNGKALEELKERIAVQASANVEAFEKLFGSVEEDEPALIASRNGNH